MAAVDSNSALPSFLFLQNEPWLYPRAAFADRWGGRAVGADGIALGRFARRRRPRL